MFLLLTILIHRALVISIEKFDQSPERLKIEIFFTSIKPRPRRSKAQFFSYK